MQCAMKHKDLKKEGLPMKFVRLLLALIVLSLLFACSKESNPVTNVSKTYSFPENQPTYKIEAYYDHEENRGYYFDVSVSPAAIIPSVDVDGIFLKSSKIESDVICVGAEWFPSRTEYVVTVRLDSLVSTRHIIRPEHPLTVNYAGKSVALPDTEIQDTISKRDFIDFAFAGQVGNKLFLRVGTYDSTWSSYKGFDDSLINPNQTIRISTTNKKYCSIYAYSVSTDQPDSGRLPSVDGFLAGTYYFKSRSCYGVIVLR